jgi:hypothetical protein
MGLTPVIGFLHDLGIDILTPSFDEVVGLLQNRIETTVAADPARATVTIQGDAESLSISLDDDMGVLDVSRHSSV